MASDAEKTTLQRLMELKDLYESGIITKEEMVAKKLQILGTDNPQVDSPNEEIRDELNIDGLNQTDDSYKPDKICSSTDDAGKEEQSESNSKQGKEQNKETDHKQQFDRKKILILSLITAAVVVVIVVLSIVLIPTDYNKKVAKAIEKYETQNATILSTSGMYESTKNNHYVIFQKGDTIYIDELERKTPVRAILPRKGGFFIKQVAVEFDDTNLKFSNKLLNDGKKSNLKIRSMHGENNALNGQRAVCLKEIVDGDVVHSYFYSLYNPDTIYMFGGELITENNSSRFDYVFTFADVVDEYIPDWWEFSLRDYWFVLSAYYFNRSMRFERLGNLCKIKKDEYPIDLLKQKFHNQDFEYGFPAYWFGTYNIRDFISCLEQDVDRKTNEANLNRILSQTVNFGEMCYEFNTNPVNAARLFPFGKRMFLAVKVDKIDYSQLDGYKYIVFSKRDDDNCYIHTNDERFASVNYPTTVLVEVEFEKRFRHEGQDLIQAFLGELFDVFDYQIKYIFKDAKLISCEDCGNVSLSPEFHPQSNNSESRFVVIDGSQLRLRLGPSTSSDTFKWPDGTNRHPNVGDKFRYLGESGDFYKIDFNGNELWVSKQYSHLE